MNRVFFAGAVAAAFAFIGSAHATTTLSISSCNASGVTFTYSTTESSASVIAAGASGEEAFVELSATSGTETTDFAAAWGGSDNSNISLELFGGNETASASCP